MYRFFKSLLQSRHRESSTLPKHLLDAAIERTVERTDRRLRALGGYRRQLREPVARSMQHLIELVGQLPAANEISPVQYGNDPRLRAAFASPSHLGEVLARFQTVRDYLGCHSGVPPDQIFGLLIMSRQRRRVLGMELEGTLLKRDVLQTAVSFSDHRYIAPADTEQATRSELEKRAFDFLLERAAERIGEEKLQRGELLRSRQSLRRQLAELQPDLRRRRAVGAETSTQAAHSYRLEAEIRQIEARLGSTIGIKPSLDESLRVVIDTLNRVDEFLMLRTLQMNLDHRGIEVTGVVRGGTPIVLNEFVSSNGLRRIVLLGSIPRRQLPNLRDPIKRGEARLGPAPGR